MPGGALEIGQGEALLQCVGRCGLPIVRPEFPEFRLRLLRRRKTGFVAGMEAQQHAFEIGMELDRRKSAGVVNAAAAPPILFHAVRIEENEGGRECSVAARFDIMMLAGEFHDSPAVSAAAHMNIEMKVKPCLSAQT